MSKIYNTSIKKYQFQQFERIFDNSISEYIKTTFTDKDASVYAIAKTKGVKLLPDSFAVVDNLCVTGNVDIGGQIKSVTFDIADTWYSSESDLAQCLRRHFYNKQKFIDHYLRKAVGLYFDPSLTYKRLASIDKAESSDKILAVNCPFAAGIYEGEETRTRLPLYQMINFFNLYDLVNLDIEYIGKSTSSPYERLKGHEKWGPIMASMDRTADYFVFFFEVATQKIERSLSCNTSTICIDDPMLKKDEIARLCEAALINFFKPRFNNEFVDTDLNNTELVKKLLIGKGYTEFVTEFELDGPFGQLGTSHAPFETRQEIRLPLA